MEKVTLNVTGMTCGHCEKAVKNALNTINGVQNVTVYLESGKVEVQYDSQEASVKELKDAIENQGYDVA
ncbi:copper chaperone CopZ [Bacillus aquiflavi]|uniref:Copper chaperone CopZ n=1 Tax=Bacillus aquiflavi TaxID=2672567 RepID=A0A6B3W1Z8_9BACI|nr:copper chaperone CopZ [Bacillus aquiflavi]MBA4537746.1 copper chaperone CopZ [Bacillus aquiflavi]NEY82003.1 copper chaperone CopZ [Bacillus aquiflavi]